MSFSYWKTGPSETQVRAGHGGTCRFPAFGRWRWADLLWFLDLRGLCSENLSKKISEILSENWRCLSGGAAEYLPRPQFNSQHLQITQVITSPPHFDSHFIRSRSSTPEAYSYATQFQDSKKMKAHLSLLWEASLASWSTALHPLFCSSSNGNNSE